MSDRESLPDLRHTPVNVPGVADQYLHDLLAPVRDPSAQFITNLPNDRPECQQWLTEGLAGDTEDLPKWDGKTFHMSFFLAHVTEKLLPDTGELLPLPHVILFSSTGEKLQWFSRHTTRYLGIIMAMRGKGPWVPPLPLLVVSHKGKSQGYWYSLQLNFPKQEIGHGKKANHG